jgi:hypothetical protein
MTAHAVRDREQVRAGVRRVLVPLPAESDVRTGRIVECERHARAAGAVTRRFVLGVQLGMPEESSPVLVRAMGGV